MARIPLLSLLKKTPQIGPKLHPHPPREDGHQWLHAIFALGSLRHRKQHRQDLNGGDEGRLSDRESQQPRPAATIFTIFWEHILVEF